MSSNTLLWAAALIAGELIFVMIAVSIYYWFRNKPKPSGHVTATPSKLSTPVPEAHPPIDYSYWEDEISRTNDALIARNEYALSDIENIDLLSLNLRLQILKLEQNIAQTETSRRDIESIEIDICKILKRFRILHALNLLDNNHNAQDDQETRDLIEHQKKTIAFLKKYTREILDKILQQNETFLGSKQGPEDIAKLNNAHNDFLDQSQSLMQKIDQLESYNQELTQCVAVLEDENQFLREQIATLLKITDAKHTAAE